MTKSEFITEFAPIVQVFGVDSFPPVVLDLMHRKTKDLDKKQFAELKDELLVNCKFAPKVPDVIEFANLIRSRHRTGETQQFKPDDGIRSMSPDKVKELMALAFNKTK